MRRCCRGANAEPGAGTRIDDVGDQTGVAAVVRDQDVLKFTPQRMGRQDAEVAADIGNDCADGPAADLGGDLFRCGQAGETGVDLVGARRRLTGSGSRAGGRDAGGLWRRIETGSVAGDSRFERGGAVEAAGDAREDQCQIGCAKGALDKGGVGDGAPPDRAGEFLAVIDQLVEEAEKAAAAGGFVRDGRLGCVGGGGRGGHERNKNTSVGRMSRNIFRLSMWRESSAGGTCASSSR
jgi:hypothetical protein